LNKHMLPEFMTVLDFLSNQLSTKRCRIDWALDSRSVHFPAGGCVLIECYELTKLDEIMLRQR
jgi:hypothetical protein